MNKDKFSPNFIQKHFSFREKTINILTNLILNGSDVVVLGPSGCGKSSLVLDLLNEEKVFSFDFLIKINCIGCPNKALILNGILNEMNEILGIEMQKECRKFDAFWKGIQEIEKKHKLWGKKMVIVLDNVEKMEVEETFFTHLFELKEVSQLQINIIFIGMSLKEDILIKNYHLSLIPKISLGVPPEPLLRNIIQNFLEEFKPDWLKEGKITKFVKEFEGNFFQVTKNIDILLKVAKLLAEINKDKRLMDNRITKMLVMNPWLDYEEIKKKLKEIDGFSNEKTKMEDVGNTNIIDQYLLNLPRIPLFILSACYFGCRNPEKTDRILFKAYKGYSSSKKSLGTSKNLYKDNFVSFPRLLALTQSLMSTCTKNLYEKEIQLFDQSVMFYSQIGDLMEKGYLKKVSPKTELNINKLKFGCNVDSGIIKMICEKINVTYEEFLNFENS